MSTNWNKHRQYVSENIGVKSTAEIAAKIGVTEFSLMQFIHRERIFHISQTPRNLAYEIVKLKFVHPEYFRPTRQFFRAVKMSQREWWRAYRGEVRLTKEQYKRLVEHLNVTLTEALELRQIELKFDDNEEV